MNLSNNNTPIHHHHQSSGTPRGGADGGSGGASGISSAVFLSPPKLKKSYHNNRLKSGSSSSSSGGSDEKKPSRISRLVADALSGNSSTASPFASGSGFADPTATTTSRTACLFIPDDFEDDDQEDEYSYLYNEYGGGGPDGGNGVRPRQRSSAFLKPKPKRQRMAPVHNVGGGGRQRSYVSVLTAGGSSNVEPVDLFPPQPSLNTMSPHRTPGGSTCRGNCSNQGY